MTRHDALIAWVRTRGGVAHTSDARRAGFTKADAVAALASGTMRRERRSWLVCVDADPRLVSAAAVSGRVTCVTEAAMSGLWVPPHTGTHVAVARGASRFDSFGRVVHWAQGPVPTTARSIRDHPINVLFHVARCLDPRDALTVWESAIRQEYVDRRHLTSVLWGSSRAHELAHRASWLSDSGLETLFIDGIRLLGVPIAQQVWLEGHPVDALLGQRLVVQLDGFAHHRAADRRRDIRHDAVLQSLGYTVLRFDFQQLLFDWEFVERTVALAIAQGRHLARH